MIAKLLADVAREEKADAVAHGCTGKGNDQVRLDVSLQVLNPKLQIIAPVREWKMTRDEEIRYAEEHNIPVEAKIKVRIAQMRISGVEVSNVACWKTLG